MVVRVGAHVIGVTHQRQSTNARGDAQRVGQCREHAAAAWKHRIGTGRKVERAQDADAVALDGEQAWAAIAACLGHLRHLSVASGTVS